MKLLLLACLFQQTGVFSQQIKLKGKQLDGNGKIAFAIPEINLVGTAENEIMLLQSVAGPEKRLTFHLVKTVTDNKYQHNYYSFSFMHLEIVGADYVIHSTNKVVLFANGNVPEIKDSIYHANPQISFDQAKSLLYSRLLENNKKFGIEYLIKKVSNKGLIWFYRGHRLVLSYKIEVKSLNLLQTGIYIIDALTGNQLEFYPEICKGFNDKRSPPNAAGS